MYFKTVLPITLLAVLFSLAASRQDASAQSTVTASPTAVTDNIQVQPPLYGRPGYGGFVPSQIRHAYGFDHLMGGSRPQIIAIIEAYGSPTLTDGPSGFNDLYVFTHDLQANISVHYPQGKPTTQNQAWALQTSVDAEWAFALAMASGANVTVELVVAQTDSLTDLLDAVDYAVKKLGASQVSMPWGVAEFSTETSYDAHFNHPGVTFFAPTGDNSSGVMWPAASPYVVAVGGTNLALDASGNRLSETGWSYSGGGVSAYESKPSFQNGWQSALTRSVPDVSYEAGDGFLVAFGNKKEGDGINSGDPPQWYTVSGTGAGATQWAVLMAIANAGRNSSLSMTGAALYSIAGKSYSTAYFDITSGSNGGFSCSAGYDMVTGLGSPMAQGLVPALIAKP